MAGRESSAKRWMLTRNNPTEIELQCGEWMERLVAEGHAKYVAGQVERGEQGTLHIQAFLYLNDKKRLNQVKALLGDQWHCEVARSGDVHCNRYVTKEDTRVEGPWTFGTLDNEQGKRSDLEEVSRLVLQGKDLKEIAETHPMTYIKFHNGLRALSNQVNGSELKRDPVTVSVFYGVSNCGKTHYVLQQMIGKRFHRQKAPYTFWDGLETQTEVLLLDDFRGEMPFQDFLQIVDQHYLRLQVKGSSVCCRFTTVWITSNLSPYEWYPKEMTDETCRRALRRRLSAIYWVTATQRNVPADFVLNPAYVENAPVPEDEFPRV